MNTEKRNDEIDLIELFLNIYIFFKKHFWLLFISAFIGAGLGYSTKFFAKKHYESTMIINSYTLSENILIEYFDNFNKLIKDNNISYLSKMSKIDSSKLRSLNEIKAEIAYDEKEKKNKGYLYVKVNVTNNEILGELSQGLLNFIEQEPYAKSEIDIYKENNNNLIAKLNDEINKLERLQANLLSPSQTKGDVNIFNEQKSFQDEILSLIKEKQSREKLIKFAAPFRIIQDFTIFQKPVRKTVTYTLTGGFLFGFLALFYLIFRNINKNIKEKGLD